MGSLGTRCPGCDESSVAEHWSTGEGPRTSDTVCEPGPCTHLPGLFGMLDMLMFMLVPRFFFMLPLIMLFPK